MKSYEFNGWKVTQDGQLIRPKGKAQNLADSKGRLTLCGKKYEIYQIVWCIVHNTSNIPAGYEIHHINHNHYDCRPENLIALPHKEHIEAHKIMRRVFQTRDFSEYDNFITYWRNLEPER